MYQARGWVLLSISHDPTHHNPPAPTLTQSIVWIQEFEHGLQVIVCSVTHLKRNEWETLVDCFCQISTSRSVHLWRDIGCAMFDLRQDVHDILQYHSVAQALSIAEDALQTDNPLEQIAFVACLYHERQTQVKARMLFTYLLQHHDTVTQQLHRIKGFLLNLTPRQREVAIWVGQGYTNPEIARALNVKSESVAEYLTTVYADFGDTLQIETDTYGLRYRLIYWLTRLFGRYPDLLIG